ncbi:hypothetical protein BgiBS90_021646 [Biomphalaria glabrata]|nr:hypothetical protein BgiBS90_021646 [Biomphalaria glabrata]
MDSDTATRFVASLAQSIQALCHGYVDFHSSIEVIGHIYLNVDNGSKFNYIVNEEVSKFPHTNRNSSMFRTHSYYSVPPNKLNSESPYSLRNLDAEIVVVSNSSYGQATKEWNSALPLDQPVNLSSPAHVSVFDSEQINANRRKSELPSPAADPNPNLTEKSQSALLNPNQKRKRKKSETKKYVYHIASSDEDVVESSVLNNNLEADLTCDNESLVDLNDCKKKTTSTSCSSCDIKSTPAAPTLSVNKKRRKSEPSKYVPHLTMRDPDTNEHIYILKSEPSESYQNAVVESDCNEQDEYAAVKKELYLNEDFCEPLSSCDLKDALSYTSSRDQALEFIKNSSLNFQRDSSLLDTLNASFSPSSKTITTQLRHQIVEYANIVGNRPAARHFGVHESSIRHWRKRFIYGDAAVKKKKKKKDLLIFDKEIENVQMVDSPISISS